MRELQEILALCSQIVAQGKSAVLATVVKVNGSAYRRPGARMLILPDGRLIGSVSGGCLEQDVAERAASMGNSDTLLVDYDLTADEEAISGLGMGCQGWVEILIESVLFKRQFDYRELLADCLRQKQSAVLATIFRVQGELGVEVGDRYLLREDGTACGNIANETVAAIVGQTAEQAMRDGHTRTLAHDAGDGAVEVLYEVIRPTFLVIAGANQNVAPIITLAHDLGWHITVCDYRRAQADRQKFPQADAVICCRPEQLTNEIGPTGRSAVVLVSHNHHYDSRALACLLPSPVAYIGLLGARSRSQNLLAGLAAEGITFTGEQLTKLYTPIGLDIGADTPQEMAVAVIAEIIAVLAGRGGTFLRDRKQPIHS